MHVEFESRGSFSARAVAALPRLARKTLEEFFRHFDEDAPTIKLMAFSAGPGGDRQNLIKVVSPHPDFGHAPIGVPVVVYTEGSQGLTSLLQIEGKTDDQVKSILESGPYNHKKRRTSEKSDAQDAFEAVGTKPVAAEEVIPPAPPPESVSTGGASSVVLVGPAPSPSAPKKKFSPREKLVASGVGEEEIERLRATLSSIVYREVGESEEIPNTIRVSVEKVTRAILEHMKLPYNEAGNYRGIIGNFYSTRFALFALKVEDSTDPDATYTDWAVDCDLVLDFVGGKDQLHALTRTREAEIAERVAEEQKPKAPPPTAEEVKEAVLEGFSADAEILDIASKMLYGKRDAEAKLQQAEANERGAQEEVVRVQALLHIAEENLRLATSLREQAEAKLARFTLSDDIREKVIQAKARFDALMKDLGL